MNMLKLNAQGNIELNGALVGFEIWDKQAALILQLSLEQFAGMAPEAPSGAEAFSLADGVPGEPDESKSSVRLLQIAVPYQEALKLGWSLAEAAQQALHPSEPLSRPV